METNDKETCIQFGLSNANKCSYCQNWETRRLTNPGKKRTTKCLRPWEFRKGANPSKANNGTIKRVCDCWDQMILHIERGNDCKRRSRGRTNGS